MIDDKVERVLKESELKRNSSRVSGLRIRIKSYKLIVNGYRPVMQSHSVYMWCNKTLEKRNLLATTKFQTLSIEIKRIYLPNH